MSNFISGSGFIQAAMLRICVGLIFVGLAVAAHTAQSEESPFAPGLDILTIQPVRASADRLLPYHLNASITLTRSAEAAPAGSGFGNTPQFHIVAEPKKEAVWSTNARWQIAPDSDRISLSPVLRFESKEGRFEIKPRRHSVWFGWRKTFP
ncbi:MAG: hypothetical protein PHD65_07630 [Gallionella sp.]|nr:hypothetical protein [Gallionella sp.]